PECHARQLEAVRAAACAVPLRRDRRLESRLLHDARVTFVIVAPGTTVRIRERSGCCAEQIGDPVAAALDLAPRLLQRLSLEDRVIDGVRTDLETGARHRSHHFA